jgi:hypothetical protein
MWFALAVGVVLFLAWGVWRMFAIFTSVSPTDGETPPMTPATSEANPADAPIGPPGANQESRLDEALEESFPASDPVSVRIE